ncbi:MAG: hypothetical protein U1G07_12835 [Verrucomicrobiota bacterium]
MKVGLFRIAVFGMAGHGDIPFRPFLIQSGAQLAAIQDPLLEFSHGLALTGAHFKVIEQGRDLPPIAEIDPLRNKAARRVAGQFVER